MVRGKKIRSSMATRTIGLSEARERVRLRVQAMPAEDAPLEEAVYRVLARAVRSRVDCPTAALSLKDGFAVRSRDTWRATPVRPIRLCVLGSRYAGGSGDLKEAKLRLKPGTAVRVTSGAMLPMGADAVAAEELCAVTVTDVRVKAQVVSGQDVHPQGADLKSAVVVGRVGDLLTPGRIGLLAAAGVACVPVHCRPRVALIATGDELVAQTPERPGKGLKPGQAYASNLSLLSAWLRAFGIESFCTVVSDRIDAILGSLRQGREAADAAITIGGAWGSERDLTVSALDELGWRKVFHRVRLTPGKAVAFGLHRGQPVFCLPGGPSACEAAFLEIALPGILQMAGWREDPFPRLEARLRRALAGGEAGWTRIVRGTLSQDLEGVLWAAPVKSASRLESMALAGCLIPITEGMAAGQLVPVRLLVPPGCPGFGV